MILAQVVHSQVFVGENVYISEGTEVTVKNQDITVENAIKGNTNDCITKYNRKKIYYKNQ